MNVAALISRLSKLDPHLPVIMPSEDTDWCMVAGAYEDVAAFAGHGWQIAHEGEANAEKVVRLFGPE